MSTLCKLLGWGTVAAAAGAVTYALTAQEEQPQSSRTLRAVDIGADPPEPPPVDHGRTAHMAEEKNWLAKAYAKLWAAGMKVFANLVSGGTGGKLAGPYIDQFAAGVLKMEGGDKRHFFNTRSNEEVAATALAVAREQIPKLTTRASGGEGKGKVEHAQREVAMLNALGLSAASFADNIQMIDAYRNALRFLLAAVGARAVTHVYGAEHGAMGRVVYGLGTGYWQAMQQALLILLYGREALKPFEDFWKASEEDRKHMKKDDVAAAVSYADSVTRMLDALKPAAPVKATR